MKVCDLLNESSINLQSKAENKREAIKALVKLMNKNKNLKKVGEFQKVVIETEEKENADSSSGYVVLCGKTNNVTRLGLSIIVTKEEIEFNENKVKTLFLLAVPDNKSDTYLEIIDELNLLLGNNEFREKLLSFDNEEEFMNLFFDVEIKDSEDKEKELKDVGSHIYKGISQILPFILIGGLLIVLSFLFDNFSTNPNNLGLNTPFASFFNIIGCLSLEIMYCLLAGFIGHSIAGREGFATGFIGGILTNSGLTFASLSEGATLIGSGFFGSLLVGLGSGYLINLLKRLKLFSSLSESNSNLLNTFISILLISVVTVVFINPCATLLNHSVFDYLNSIEFANKILLGAVLGGMMTIDLGGPINKAAYAFGLTTLANGHYDIMAAIMAGSMVPPLTIAILTTFFPQKIENRDKGVGFLNYLFGFAGITEGAIYFAGKDLKTIPAFVVGGACASVASIIFTCTLKAPLGGLFAISLITHPILFIISVLFGAVAGALILFVLKEDIK